MKKPIDLDALEKDVKTLPPEEQIELIERVARRLRLSGVTSQRKLDWGPLYGLGKGLWDEDAQEYVDRLREERT